MKREKVVARYRENLSGVTGITLPLLQAGTQSNYAYFPVLFDEDLLGISRDEVFAALAQKNIHARKYFYPLTSDFECYRNRFDSSLTPIACRVASQVLTLPLYADLTLGTVDSICDIILETLHSANVAGAEETR